MFTFAYLLFLATEAKPAAEQCGGLYPDTPDDSSDSRAYHLIVCKHESCINKWQMLWPVFLLFQPRLFAPQSSTPASFVSRSPHGSPGAAGTARLVGRLSRAAISVLNGVGRAHPSVSKRAALSRTPAVTQPEESLNTSTTPSYAAGGTKETRARVLMNGRRIVWQRF